MSFPQSIPYQKGISVPISGYGYLYPLYAQSWKLHKHVPDVSHVSGAIHFFTIKHRQKSWSEQKLITLKIM